MKKILLIILSLTVFGWALSVEDETIVDKHMKNFQNEWKLLNPLYKANIQIAYTRGEQYGLGFTAAGATFIETRGVPNRVNINPKNKIYPTTFDCGVMGSNTYWYLRYRGIKKPTTLEQMTACMELNSNSMLSFEHFLKVITDATSRKAIQNMKGTKMYWRLIWNYYNTGRVVLKGNYYLKMIAAIRFLKTVIRTNSVGYVVDTDKIKMDMKRARK